MELCERHWRILGLVLTCAVVLGACARPPRVGPVGPGGVATAVPGTLFTVDPESSRLVVLVYREGPLAALGHNHVVVFPRLAGEIVVPRDLHLTHGELSVPVEGVLVDEPAERTAAGADFARALNAADIAGTREHLLGDAQLDAGRFPSVTATIEGASEGPESFVLNLRIVFCGHATQQQFPARVRIEAGQLSAEGEVELKQSELGIKPYTALLGALAVRDAILVQYRLVARAGRAGAG